MSAVPPPASGKVAAKGGLFKLDLNSADNKEKLHAIQKEEDKVDASIALAKKASARGSLLGTVLSSPRGGRPLSSRAISIDGVHYKKPLKKPVIRGPIIEEGSLGWELMCDMLTGIRVTV